MIKHKIIFLAYLLCLICLGCFSRGAQAFSCTSNGVSIGGTGTFTIPVNITISKSSSQITLTDMSAYSTCTGDWGRLYQDALKTTSATLSAALTGIGFSGYLIASGAKSVFPATDACIWPTNTCTTISTGMAQTQTPLNVIIGMERLTVNRGQAATIPAGTEIARLTVNQRSKGDWGWPKTWIFKTNAAIYIPAYTCAWNNPNQTVTLPEVMKRDLVANGAGKYPEPTPFKLNLTCDPETTVSVQFDGTTMAGKTDVLANSAGENQDVGVQLVYNSAPVIFAQKVKVIDSSDTQETLSYQAHYYYNGGANIQGGAVNATTTVTFTYQ